MCVCVSQFDWLIDPSQSAICFLYLLISLSIPDCSYLCIHPCQLLPIYSNQFISIFISPYLSVFYLSIHPYHTVPNLSIPVCSYQSVSIQPSISFCFFRSNTLFHETLQIDWYMKTLILRFISLIQVKGLVKAFVALIFNVGQACLPWESAFIIMAFDFRTGGKNMPLSQST